MQANFAPAIRQQLIVATSFLLLSLHGQSVMAQSETETTLPPPVEMTANEDHQLMMDALQIKSIRRGANGRDPNASPVATTRARPHLDRVP